MTNIINIIPANKNGFSKLSANLPILLIKFSKKNKKSHYRNSGFVMHYFTFAYLEPTVPNQAEAAAGIYPKQAEQAV